MVWAWAEAGKRCRLPQAAACPWLHAHAAAAPRRTCIALLHPPSLHREGIPDPRAIDYPWENKPYTDVIGAFFALISSNTVVWEPDTQTMNTAFSNALKKGGRSALLLHV